MHIDVNDVDISNIENIAKKKLNEKWFLGKNCLYGILNKYQL